MRPVTCVPLSNHCNELRSSVEADGSLRRSLHKGIRRLALLAILVMAVVWSLGQASATTLTSDTTGKGGFTDPNMLNSWGLQLTRDGLLWVANNHSGYASLYLANGQPTSTAILIPSPDGKGMGAPTGLVLNQTNGFRILLNGASSGSADNDDFSMSSSSEGEGEEESEDSQFVRSRVIVSTEQGTLAAWGPGLETDKAVIVVDHSASGAIYKGLALARVESDYRLYASDFYNAKVDMFDSNFQLIGSFKNTHVPDGYAPFGIQVIGRQLIVTYAKQALPEKEDDEPGPGNGYVAVFNLKGDYQRTLISKGPLNSPWAVALAPGNFGAYSRTLLIGNFGDGVINVFDRNSGHFQGSIMGATGPLMLDGLWGLAFRRIPNLSCHLTQTPAVTASTTPPDPTTS